MLAHVRTEKSQYVSGAHREARYVDFVSEMAETLLANIMPWEYHYQSQANHCFDLVLSVYTLPSDSLSFAFLWLVFCSWTAPA